jgi:diguanylate cyclase (GGDEF)-like protein
MIVACACGAHQLELNRRREFLSDRLLEYRANVDDLSRLPNRGAFDARLTEAWRMARDSGEGFAVMLLDIDYFKAYNDTYGHQAGDETLRRVSTVLATAMRRPRDFAARYGGEEFAVIVSGVTSEAAMQIAERIRESVRDLTIPHAASDVASVVTVSVGVCWNMPRHSTKSPADLVRHADEALYLAKDSGRNCSMLTFGSTRRRNDAATSDARTDNPVHDEPGSEKTELGFR